MDPAAARLATSPQATDLADRLRTDTTLADPLRATTRLRGEGHDPDLVAAVITQETLRTRARAKWPDADSMVFTPDGVEQATRGVLADRHAARFVAAGVSRVLDLGCGIGADARAVARAGLHVDAVDADETTAVLAAHNLAGFDATVHVGRAQDADVQPTDGVWLDPARRTPGVADVTGRTKRVFRLDDISPTWDDVQALAGRARAAGAKLSPAFPHAALPQGCEAQWASVDGEVLECVVWWGTAVRTPGRSALVVARDGSAHEITEADASGAASGLAEGPDDGEWLYEPDRAVIRAGLVGALEARVRGRELDPGVGYTTSDEEHDVPWARRYRVVERMPLHAKTFRAWARAHDVARVTIKRRGQTPDPDVFRRELRLPAKAKAGAREATIVLTTDRGTRTLLVVTPA